MAHTGCPNALVSSLEARTPVLTADGRLRRVTDLRTGDRVYGTRWAKRRRYAETAITAHRVALQPAYRVRLADGTELIVGADQCFLTYRGWKHVTGAQQGQHRRPHLTLRSKLLGIGHFRASPEESPDYRLGYLCGLIRGDGHVGSYVCTAPGKAPGVKHGFRLALADLEALDRARSYLVETGVAVKEFVFQRATPSRRMITALGNQSKAGVERVRQLVRWPLAPSDAWRVGFLAGIFDAEGSCATREALRISNTDPRILERIQDSLAHFGFDVVRESTAGRNGVAYIRIRGGLREQVRFFQMTDPAITRKRSFLGLALQSDADLRVTSIEPLARTIPLHGVTTESGDLIADGVIVSAGVDASR